MNDLTDIIENRMLDWLTGVGTPLRPSTPLRVALFTSMPDRETGTGGIEVSGGSYARTTVTFAAAASGATSNTADVTFPTASANWGILEGIGVYDNVGLLLWTGMYVTTKLVNTGETMRILSGTLVLELD